MPERLCRDCKNRYFTFSNLQTRCPDCQRKRDAAKPKKERKPITQRGKRYDEYEEWKHEVAIPHLIEKYGDRCLKCGRTRHHLNLLGLPLDVDHIKKRSTHPHLKMELSNVRLLCRDCHQERDRVRL